MSVIEQDIEFYGCASMPSDDSSTVGGAIDTSVKVVFEDLQISGENVAIVASTTGASDNVTVYGRNVPGELIQETKALNGRNMVVMTTNTTWDRLIRATKDTSGNYHVAVVAANWMHSGVAQGGTANTLTLVASGSATNNFYQFKVGRIVSDGGGGAVSGHLFTVTSYLGSTKVAKIKPAFSGTVGTPTYVLYDGMLMEAHPSEVRSVTKLFRNVSADVDTGSQRIFYEKFFIKNNNTTKALTLTQVQKTEDPTGNIAWIMSSGLNTTETSTNRVTLPPTMLSGTWITDTTARQIPNAGNHSVGSGVPVWARLTLDAGEAAANTYFIMREQGQST